ncbi:MAG: hypothetical protein ACE5FO_03285 [Parvularculaceae bacterium]
MKLVKFLAAFGLVLLVGGCARTAPAPETTKVDIAVRHAGEGVWRLSYRLSTPAEALRFGRPVGDFRAQDWTIETPGAHLATDQESETVVSDTGRFSALEITVREKAIAVEKDYAPFYPFSDGGALFYVGHFIPDVIRGAAAAPALARFEFFASRGESVLVFDRRGARVAYEMDADMSPFFAYFGTSPVIQTETVAAIVDPEIPDWIDDALQGFIPRLFTYYRDAFGTKLPRKPNIFLASAFAERRDGYSFHGDALPGQFQVTLAGEGWRKPSKTGLDLLAFHVAHEAAHLWQNLAQPIDGNQPEWIHEGGADAVAAEALVALGLWTDARATEDFDKAATTCAQSLEAGALSGAGRRGDYRALYACGRVIAVAVARAEGEGTRVAGFWAAFIERARGAGGYSDALFFDLAEERSGRPEFARALRRFAQTPFAEPEREVSGFLVFAAGPDGEPFPLEPDAAR